MTGSHWTEERVAEMIRLRLTEGWSASQIAKKLGGITRNAVLGKLHRLGLLNRALPSAPRVIRTTHIKGAGAVKAARERSAQAKPHVERVYRNVNPLGPKSVERITDAAPLKAVIAFEPLPGSAPRPWEERGKGCTWPIGDGLSCCEPVKAFGWCATHVATGRVPVPPSSRNLVRSLRRYC